MATCKDCLHVDVCCSYLSTVYNKCKLATPDFELLKNIECDECQHFKDRSRFVELPASDGFRTVRNVDDLGRVLIPKCMRREYDINYRDRILFIPINESKILVSKFLGSKKEEQALKLKEREHND